MSKMLPNNQFPPSSCSQSVFTQWLLSEYSKDLQEQQKHLTTHPPPQHTQQQKTPPPTPTSSSSHHHHHHPHTFQEFTSSLRQLFSTHKHPSSSSKNNNLEYKNGISSSSPSSVQSSPSTPPDASHHQPSPKNIEFIQLLALNALEFTAPIYSFLNKKSPEKKVEAEKPVCVCPSTRSFIQISGHPGSFAPAGPKTCWKKLPMGDAICGRDQFEGHSLRVLLEGLSINGEQPSPPPPPRTQQLNKESSPPPPPLTPHTTPVTVFFPTQSEPSSNSSSSSPPVLQLQPQVFSIPTDYLPNECRVYRKVNSANDPIKKITPTYVTETCYNNQMFLELEDLLTNFSKPNPTIMDIKLGTRTFLENECSSSKPRPDLYQKLISVDPTACTQQEHIDKAITKLTYMLFREKQSSSTDLGFRVEGVKIGNNGKYNPENQLDDINFKVLKLEHQIITVFKRFCKQNPIIAKRSLERLHFIRDTLEQSEFFMTHEVIGSSLLFIHDDDKVGIWLIDFAKTFPVNGRLSHREPWELGNSEDGVLVGVDSTIRMFGDVVKDLEEEEGTEL